MHMSTIIYHICMYIYIYIHEHNIYTYIYIYTYYYSIHIQYMFTADAVLCYAMLYYAMLYYAILCFVILCYAISYYPVLSLLFLRLLIAILWFPFVIRLVECFHLFGVLVFVLRFSCFMRVFAIVGSSDGLTLAKRGWINRVPAKCP